MAAATEWRDCETDPMPMGQFLLVWVTKTGIAQIGKMTKTGVALGGGFRLARNAISHWTEIVPPAGVPAGEFNKTDRTTRDSQS